MKRRWTAGLLSVLAAVTVFFAWQFVRVKKESVALGQAVLRMDQSVETYSPLWVVNSLQKALFEEAAEQPDDALFTYRAEEGYLIKSYASAWNDTMLKALSAELLENRHGKEIETLSEIIIHAEENPEALAQHSEEMMTIRVPIRFSILPKNFAVKISRDASIIELFGGDANQTVESFAASLSHEYGHLFTFYYMFHGHDDLQDTVYAALRRSREHELITAYYPEVGYYEDHHRYLFEVAAEDYVQLMGSSNTRGVADYPDISEQMSGKKMPTDSEWNSTRNAFPQENLMLPLAGEVDGLAEYFYSFIDEKPPHPSDEKRTIELQIEKKSDRLSAGDYARRFDHYVVTWNAPYKDAVYTLVCYDPDDYYVIPVRTVRDGAQRAIIGTVAEGSGIRMNWWRDEIDRGTKVFLVVAQLPDGTYYLSNPLSHSFEGL